MEWKKIDNATDKDGVAIFDDASKKTKKKKDKKNKKSIIPKKSKKESKNQESKIKVDPTAKHSTENKTKADNKINQETNKEQKNLKTPKTAEKRTGFFWSLLKILCAFIVACFAAAAIFIGITAHNVGDINPKNIYSNIEQTSYLYDVHDEQIDTLHYDEDRKVISIDEMPDDLKNAFIAIEDKTFYEHHGFNFKRMIGAILHSFTSNSQISGTSTITQQLARNVYLSEIKGQRSIRRKVTEMYIAWRIEKSLSKDQILEAYLNTIYLGYGNYGVNAAAKTYFSKTVDQLTLPECAALAALPQAPDTYALISNDQGDGRPEIPVEQITRGTDEDLKNVDQETADGEQTAVEDSYDAEMPETSGLYANDVSKDRRNLVLQLMTEQGYITSQEANAAHVDIIDIIRPRMSESDSVYTYFTDYVSQQVIHDLMEQYEMTEEEAQQMVYTGGLKIHTTLDSEVQNVVYQEFADDYNFPGTVDGSEVQASMVITEVGTGHIVAMAGGRNTSGSKLFNRALNARQPGSSIKPLAVYGAALQKSFEFARDKKPYPFIDYYNMDRQGTKYWGDYITAGSVVVDEPLTFNGERWPENVTRRFSGWNTFRTALQQSINTCAVKILLQVGANYSIDMLEKFGITTLVTDVKEPVNDVNPASLALGAMTYGVTPLEMSMAYAVFPNNGSLNTPVCYTQVFDRRGKSILIGQTQRKEVLDPGVAWIMTDCLKSNVSKGIANSAAIYGVEVGGKTGTTNDRYDVWFDGFTPRYSAALWIGTDMNVEMTSGSWTAARLWSKIMRQIPDIEEGEYPMKPANVVEYRGEYYTFGTEPDSTRTFETEDTTQITPQDQETENF